MNTCSICQSPVVAEVNEALQKHEPLRAISARSGFSRAALSRHNRKHIARAKLEEFRAVAFNATQNQVFVHFPGRPPVQPRNWKDGDIWLEVSYEESLSEENIAQYCAAERKRLAAQAKAQADAAALPTAIPDSTN